MFDDRDEPFVKKFPARAQITKAVVRGGEILFEIDMPGARGDPEGVADWIAEFRNQLNYAMGGRNAKGRTVELLTDENDPAKAFIVYRRYGQARLEERQELTSVLIDCDVHMNNEIARCISDSFGKLGRAQKPSGPAVPDLGGKTSAVTAEAERRAEKSRTPRSR